MDTIATLNQTADRITEEKNLLLAGLIAMSRGQDDLALAAFTSLLAADEPSNLAATCAAQLLLKRRDMKGAEAHYLLGLALRGMYRNFDAIRSFRTALSLEPDNAEARMAMDELLNVQEP